MERIQEEIKEHMVAVAESMSQILIAGVLENSLAPLQNSFDEIQKVTLTSSSKSSLFAGEHFLEGPGDVSESNCNSERAIVTVGDAGIVSWFMPRRKMFGDGSRRDHKNLFRTSKLFENA